jgi:hypothetical protein
MSRIPVAHPSWSAPPMVFGDDSVCLASLPPDQRRRTWEWIKRNAPRLVDFLESDFYRECREMYGASLVLPANHPALKV